MPRKSSIIRHTGQNHHIGRLRPLAVSVCLLLALFRSGPVGGQIFVANMPIPPDEGHITVFEHGDDGDIVPQRVIEGSATGLFGPIASAVDLENRELFVLNNGLLMEAASVTVYDLGDDGNVSPKRILHDGSWLLSNPEGIVVDPINDEIYIREDFGLLYVFDRTASGSAIPLRTLTSTLYGGGDVALDLVNDELFVSDHGNGILVYPRTASGDDLPIRHIQGSNMSMCPTTRLVVDPLEDEIIVGCSSSIRVFSRSGDGNINPIRVIEGPTTGLSQIFGIALDASRSTIFVSSGQNAAVLAFPRVADGDVPPVRTIAGMSTRLDRPMGLAVSGFVFESRFESGDVNDWSNAIP